MAANLQRRWGRAGLYGTVASLWKELERGLDDDQRIILPWFYRSNRLIYDRIDGVAYLVRQGGLGGPIDWVWESRLDRILEEQDVEILTKVLIVRLRLPWNEVDWECLLTKAEYDENRDEWDVLESYFQCRDLKTGKVGIIPRVKFEENRDRYELVEIRYLATWAHNVKPIPTIAPDSVYTIMAE